jgi:Fe-S-cluster containining protein
LFITLKPEEEYLFENYRIRNEMKVDDSTGVKLFAPTGMVRKITGRFFWFQDTNGRCPHLEASGYCDVYDERPEACRVFPFEPTPGCLVWPLPWPKTLTPFPPPEGDEGDLLIGKLNE